VLSNISKVIGWTAIILWGFLSLIVLFVLIDKWTHPNIKSISNRDLKDYLKISIWLIGIFGVTRVLMYVLNSVQKKHSP
jgi:heme O synthase-like polyprenyltransferase